VAGWGVTIADVPCLRLVQILRVMRENVRQYCQLLQLLEGHSMSTRGHYKAVLKVCCLQCGTKDEVDIFLHEVNDQSARYALISAGWYQNVAGEIICPECWGLASLSEQERDAVGEALAGFSGFEGDFFLPSLTTLSEAAAVGFANIRGILALPGLTTISDVAAEALAKHEGELYLDGLTTLSDAAAKGLAKNTGDELSLSGVVSLSDVAAEALAKHGGYLELDGLTTLSDAAAEALAEHKGHLSLSGLTTLSDAAAAALAKHESLNVSGPIQPLIDKFRKRA
jgi:hypothetical protein